MSLICNVCMHHCVLSNGQTGRCKARKNIDDKIIDDNFAKVTAVSLDPIEKKPLRNFYPGSKILSVGSYGCNLNCPFCQNSEISQYKFNEDDIYMIFPDDLVKKALDLKPLGNIGIAFTYNEPLIGYEYVLETSKIAKKEGMKTVVVTNGNFSISVLDEILPYIDAMNIDLKGFNDDFYDFVGGDLKTTLSFIEKAVNNCHVEITTLIIPGKNDGLEDMDNEASYLESLDKNITLHITRYFPRYKYIEPATEVKTLNMLAKIARKHLNNVYIGNV